MALVWQPTALALHSAPLRGLCRRPIPRTRARTGRHRQANASTGFSLIELLIAVGIVGILAAIAYPSYSDFVLRGNRADAKSALLENAQFLERFYTEENAYDQDSAGNAVTLPITTAPRTGTALYNITATTLTTTTYTLTAAPIAGRRMAGDDCGSFTLDYLGVKGVTGATLSATECWNR